MWWRCVQDYPLAAVAMAALSSTELTAQQVTFFAPATRPCRRPSPATPAPSRPSRSAPLRTGQTSAPSSRRPAARPRRRRRGRSALAPWPAYNSGIVHDTLRRALCADLAGAIPLRQAPRGCCTRAADASRLLRGGASAAADAMRLLRAWLMAQVRTPALCC